MPFTREDIERREAASLASYAALAAQSRGRAFPIQPHPLRTAFQRDRDRIVHSSAFRRMEYKTQVFIPHERDHYRTRLTHTIEVAQISRTLARCLRVNEDLVEAIALAHDLGHTPFGHAGEEVLDRLLADRGGFNHNRQSLRVVDFLEQRYPEHPGLNLSYEVREGIVKHETSVKVAAADIAGDGPTLEAALVDLADEITYNAHDIDDGLSSGLISLDELRESIFWDALDLDRAVAGWSDSDDRARYAIARTLLNTVASDVIAETERRLASAGIVGLDDVRSAGVRLCGYSEQLADIVLALKSFLNSRLYKHPKLRSLSEWAGEILETVYSRLYAEPALMPVRFQEMLLTEPREAVIADYVAGMTDRFAVKMYNSLIG